MFRLFSVSIRSWNDDLHCWLVYTMIFGLVDIAWFEAQVPRTRSLEQWHLCASDLFGHLGQTHPGRSETAIQSCNHRESWRVDHLIHSGCEWLLRCVGVSINGGYPQLIHFNGIFHYKPSVVGYPHSWNPPLCPEELCFPNPFSAVSYCDSETHLSLPAGSFRLSGESFVAVTSGALNLPLPQTFSRRIPGPRWGYVSKINQSFWGGKLARPAKWEGCEGAIIGCLAVRRAVNWNDGSNSFKGPSPVLGDRRPSGPVAWCGHTTGMELGGWGAGEWVVNAPAVCMSWLPFHSWPKVE